MKLYLAGPMSGQDQFNFPAFDAATERLRQCGHDVVNPAELDREAGYTVEILEAMDAEFWDGFLREAFARDLPALCECDAIAVLSGWRESRGAAIEVALGRLLGLAILDAYTLEPVEENVLQEADRITSGDRNGDYGPPADHWGKTTGMINAAFGTSFKPRDWGMMMILDKVARETHKSKRDSLVDICGYSRCMEKVDERNAG